MKPVLLAAALLFASTVVPANANVGNELATLCFPNAEVPPGWHMNFLSGWAGAATGGIGNGPLPLYSGGPFIGPRFAPSVGRFEPVGEGGPILGPEAGFIPGAVGLAEKKTASASFAWLCGG
jgi:hypothetical protein